MSSPSGMIEIEEGDVVSTSARSTTVWRPVLSPTISRSPSVRSVPVRTRPSASATVWVMKSGLMAAAGAWMSRNTDA